jgi:hypothetical protein
MATDVAGFASQSASFGYNIYAPTPGVSSLVVYNGWGAVSGYPADYYFGQDSVFYEFDHDRWAYGALTGELLDNYTHVFEIVTNGPADYHRDAVRTWLEADGTRNYLLAGDEWLGADNSYTDQAYAPGTFEYDILGVTQSYNDVSYDGTAGQELVSEFFAVEGSALGGALYTAFQANGPTDTLAYDPNFEIGVADWHDAFDVTEDSEVFMTGTTRGIGGAPVAEVKNVGANRTTATGNKIAFMSFDPLSLNSTPDYYWYGFSDVAPQVQALKWFGADVVGVEDENVTPNSYALSQNYPNPFNPTTVISYTIPEKGNVSITVFDMLGQEVATVVNEVKNAGTHQVNFRAANLASGMYIYTIKAGDFVSSKKMMLLK